MSAFAVGERVRVRDRPVATHYRTPRYIRGRTGVIERYCGAHQDPERLAYGDRAAPRVPLYRVRFRQAEIWAAYAGPVTDSLDIELYEPWLEPIGEDARAP
ncbi:MAG: SH3-like domain-containing protein [Pseudomonadota bacterium]